jgi:carbon storage regulator
MLVLSRKAGQKIIIGQNIEVTVIELGHDRVRIGVNAPAEIPVHRQEVFEDLVATR